MKANGTSNRTFRADFQFLIRHQTSAPNVRIPSLLEGNQRDGAPPRCCR
jgi:hypothetical protein